MTRNHAFPAERQGALQRLEPLGRIGIVHRQTRRHGAELVEVDLVVLDDEVAARAQSMVDQLEASVALSKATLAARQAEVHEAEATVAEREAIFKRAEELLANTVIEGYDIRVVA